MTKDLKTHIRKDNSKKSSLSLMSIVVWIWIAATLAADLKVTVHPQIHWIVFMGCAVILVPYWVYMKKVRFLPVYPGAMLLVMSVVLHGLFSPNPAYDFQQALKLFAIFLCGLAFFVTFPHLGRIGFVAMRHSVYVNAMFLVAGYIGVQGMAQLMSPGRWGTMLNFPGSLWRVGISTVVYHGFNLVRRRGRRLGHALGLSFSLLLCYMDGSRTSLLMLVSALLVLVFALVVEGNRKWKRIGFVLLLSFGLVIGGIAFIGMANPGIELSSRAVSGVFDFIEVLLTQGIDGLDRVDATRARMLEASLKAIVDNPLLGSGIGTTRVETNVGPMRVHMSYLQVWADLGILGFLSFAWISVGWLFWMPHFMRNIGYIDDAETKGWYYNALYLLLLFALSGFFHPLSTEWSEWCVYLIGSAGFWGLVSAPSIRS